MALRGAANIGANVPPKAIDLGITYVKRNYVASGEELGGFGYSEGRGANTATTSTGILALCLLGQPNAPEVTAGGRYLVRNMKRRPSPFYFYNVYYVSQAAWQISGDVWETINPNLRRDLLQKQGANGAWPSSEAGGASETYGTSMAILALTVPYRYLPIYQR
jgi:hypothetical protein